MSGPDVGPDVHAKGPPPNSRGQEAVEESARPVDSQAYLAEETLIND